MRESAALKYTMKAAELRAIADDDHHPETRQELLRIAHLYEKLAVNYERLEATGAQTLPT